MHESSIDITSQDSNMHNVDRASKVITLYFHRFR